MAEMMNPGALAGATGARVSGNATAGQLENMPTARKGATLVRIHGEGGRPDRFAEVKGRVAWALRRLIDAGAEGVTPLHSPAPRWSDYIFKLRAAGIEVETIREPHVGAFPGHHGRYRLRSRVTVEGQR